MKTRDCIKQRTFRFIDGYCCKYHLKNEHYIITSITTDIEQIKRFYNHDLYMPWSSFSSFSSHFKHSGMKNMEIYSTKQASLQKLIWHGCSPHCRKSFSKNGPKKRFIFIRNAMRSISSCHC